MMMFVKTVLLSIKRRKKEIWFVSLVTFIAVLFMSSITLVQNVMNRYLMETNYKNYGEWVLSSVDSELSHPYFSASGSCNTGAEILKEDGSSTGEMLGSVDEGFLSIANLTFYEGRMPEAEDEIVMNLTTLAKLGYSVELGQAIHIMVQTEEDAYEKDFTLVGTIRDFANTWKYTGTKTLPACVVSPEALAEMGGTAYTTHFYQLDRTYEAINMEEFKEPFLQPGVVEFNSYVYDNTVWGSQEMFSNMQHIIILIAVLVLSYLMMSYVAKRRKWYYQLRSTGASRVQIWAMILIEGIYGTFLWAAAGFILPYLAALPVCAVISKKQDLPSIFVPDVQGICSQILMVAGIILIVLVVACISCSDRRLSNNAHEVTKWQLRRLRRASRRSRNTAKSYLKRQNKRYPLQKLAMCVCTIIVSTILVLCIHMIVWKYQDYQLLVQDKSDIEANYLVLEDNNYICLETDENGNTKEVECNLGTRGVNGVDIGMDAQMEKELMAIEGIRNIETYIQESNAFLEWEGKENSPIYAFLYDTRVKERGYAEWEEDRALEDEVSYTFIYDTYEDLKRDYGIVFELAEIDEEAFQNGEQIIVYSPSYIERASDENMELIEIPLEETTLQDGMVTWASYDTDVTVSAEAKVIRWSEEQCIQMNLYSGVYYVFADTAFAERIAEEKGTQIAYNHLQIDFEPNTSFGSTTKRLVSLLVENDFQYENYWEMKDMAKEEFTNCLCIYGTLFFMILAIYLILQMNVNQMKNYDRGQQYLLLKRLGMSDDFFMGMVIRQGIKDALWMFSGVITGYVLYAVVEYQEIFAEYGTVGFTSSFTNQNEESAFWWVMENMLGNISSTHFICTIGFVLIMIILITAIVCHSAKKSMSKEGKLS